MAGDTRTSVDVMYMNAGLDTGPIAIREIVPIAPCDTAGDLATRLAVLAATLYGFTDEFHQLFVEGRNADLHDVGELAPVIAAVAAVADGESVLSGIAHLRLHETDRLSALVKEVNGLGGDVTETDDGLRIRPLPLHGGVFHTYEDHRLATAAAVLGLVVDGVEVENVATTGKTLPDFPELWTGMLAGETAAAPARGRG